MREFLTGLAILIIGVLVTALIAPFVVDFNAQRPRIEEALSQTMGQPVAIAGSIDIRLLPFPVVDLRKVTIGTPPNGSSAFAERISLDIATMPMLKGEVHVMEAVLDQPVVTLAVSTDGIVSGLWPKDGEPTGTLISIEKFTVHDGKIALRPQGSDRPIALSKLQLEGSAVSLQGPWRVDGQGEFDNKPVGLRLSTGTADETGMFRIKATMDHPDGGFKADVDGLASLVTRLTFDGKLSIAGELPWPELGTLGKQPWSLSTLAKLDGNALDVTAAEINAGSDETGFKLNGSGSGLLGGGRSLEVLFDAKQLDLDRPLHIDGKPNPALPAVLTAWRGVLLASDDDLRPSFPVNLTVTVDSVIAGGDTIRGLRLDTKLDSDGVTLKRGVAQLPGNAKLTAAGEIGLSEGGAFSGHASFSSKEFGRFGAWIDGVLSGRSMRYGEAHDVSAEADLALSSTLVGASNLKINLDQSSITGLLRYELPDEGQRGRLDAQLASDGFDLDQLPEASLLAARFGAIDASVVINARNVRAARMKDAHAGRLQMKATASEEGLVIDTLEINDIGGANVKASGRLTAAGDRVEALIDARDVGPIAVLLRKIAPGPASTLLAERAKLLGPANFKVTAERRADKARTIALAVEGNAATTSLSGQGNLTSVDADISLDATFKTSSPDASLLLRQIGFSVLPLPLDGGGSITTQLKGSLNKGFVFALKGEVAGTIIKADLGLDPAASTASGPVAFSSPDVEPLLQALALPVLDPSAKIPVNVSGKLDWSTAKLALSALAMTSGTHQLSGHLAYEPQAGTLNGELATEAVSLPELASFVLGPLSGSGPNGLWPSSRFSTPGPPPVDVDIRVTAKQFDTGFGADVTSAKMELAWMPDSLEIRNFEGDALKGHLAGTLAVRRNSGLGSYLGKFTWNGLSIADLLPKSGMSGTADVTFDGGGSGESLATFAASLSGGGTLHTRDLVVPGFDVSALGAATKALDNERDPPDSHRVNDMIANGLLAKPLVLADVQAPLTGSNGVVRIGPVEAHSGGAQIQSGLTFDVRSLKLDGRASLVSDDAPKDWVGPQPQANVAFKGVIGGATSREVDASTLANILTTRLVSRELAHLEAQETDLRERASLARHLKQDRERAEEARLAEEARKAEEARLADEARKHAEADAAAKKVLDASENQKIIDDLNAQKLSVEGDQKSKEKEVLDAVDQLLKGNATVQLPPP